VSRKHAVIQLENIDNKLFISFQDLGSLNGSFNKNKIRLKSNLKYPFLSDDYFIIGLTKLTIKFN
jgi:pSer/pThr/pTyr-binding forkhead associated (FHA) protein